MNSQLVIGSILLVAPIVLVACIAIGLFGFNPERAQAIRSNEARSPMVLEEIRHIHIRAPDRFRHDRIDRHPFYMAISLAAWGYAWTILMGVPITSNLASLSPQTKFAMATCLLVGSTLVLSGASMGMRIGRWTLLKGIRDNLTSDMLADDVRLPYTFGGVGVAIIGMSMGIYSTTSFRSTIGSLGGWMTGCITGACLIMMLMFYVRIRRYDRARDTLINAAVARIERGDVAD